MTDPPEPAGFPTTRWSRVARAGDGRASGSRTDLADLCAAYWHPIYALIRQSGHAPDEALDLTQDYFAHLLEKGVLGRVDPRKGRFRAFLRADCGFFLSDHRDRRLARKRGGGRSFLSIDAADADRRLALDPADPGLTPDQVFDRSWARALLERALAVLAGEFAESGRAALFDQLKTVLSDGRPSTPYAAIAASLGLSPAAVESASRRMRKRFAEIVRAEIAETLDDPSPDEIEEEIRSLFVALGS